MSYKYSAFISYRHSNHIDNTTTQEKIIDSLEAELESHCELPVYRDTDRLRVGDAYNAELARSLCQSAVMVCLFRPTYFSLEHPYCAREFKGMEALEALRLKNAPSFSPKLIMLLSIRGAKNIPLVIKRNRYSEDLEEYTYDPNMQKKREFKVKIGRVAESIASTLSELRTMEQRCDCSTFTLPTTSEITPWLTEIASPKPPSFLPLTG